MKQAVPDTPSTFAALGKAPKIAGQLFIAVFDRESGQVISRSAHSWVEDGKPPAEKEAAKQALAQVERFYEALEKEAGSHRKLLASGRKPCPLAQLETLLVKDMELFEADFHVDPKTRRAVRAPPPKHAD